MMRRRIDVGTIPHVIMCPITSEVMSEPINCNPCGHTFDKHAIQNVFKSGKCECPMCHVHVASLVPNLTAKQMTTSWLSEAALHKPMPKAVKLVDDRGAVDCKAQRLIQDLGEVCLVASVGNCRMGKSFLMDCTVDQVELADRMFGVGSTVNPHTKMIDVSAASRKIEFLKEVWGIKAATAVNDLVFFDAEGTGGADASHDARVFLTTMLPASVILFQVRATWEQDTSTKLLHELAILADLVTGRNDEDDSKPLFGHLIIVIRDYSLTSTKQEMLDFILKDPAHRPENQKELVARRRVIKGAFQSISVHLLPNPFEDRSATGDSDVTMSALKTEFVVGVRDLVRTIVTKGATEARSIPGTNIPMTGNALTGFVDSVGKQLWSNPDALSLTNALGNVLKYHAEREADSLLRTKLPQRYEEELEKQPANQVTQDSMNALAKWIYDKGCIEWKQRLHAETPSELQAEIQGRYWAEVQPLLSVIKNKKTQVVVTVVEADFNRDAQAVSNKGLEEAAPDTIEAVLKQHLQTQLQVVRDTALKRAEAILGPGSALQQLVARLEYSSEAQLRYSIQTFLGSQQKKQVENLQSELRAEREAREQQQKRHEQQVRALEAKGGFLSKFVGFFRRGVGKFDYVVPHADINQNCGAGQHCSGPVWESCGFLWKLKLFPNGSGNKQNFRGNEIPNNGFVPFLMLYMTASEFYCIKNVKGYIKLQDWECTFTDEYVRDYTLKNGSPRTGEVFIGGMNCPSIPLSTLTQAVEGVRITFELTDIDWVEHTPSVLG